MKKYVSLFLVLVMCLSLCETAFAETTAQADGVQMEETGEELTAPREHTRAEETKWYYRVLDNYYVQRRLWSCTYGYWLTEWETIGYINPNP